MRADGLIRRIRLFLVIVDHGLEVSVFDNLMDSEEELECEENLQSGNSSTVPGLRLQNRFSPLDELPIVREIDEGSSDAVRRPSVASQPETASTDPAVGVPLSTGTTRGPQPVSGWPAFD